MLTGKSSELVSLKLFTEKIGGHLYVLRLEFNYTIARAVVILNYVGFRALLITSFEASEKLRFSFLCF